MEAVDSHSCGGKTLRSIPPPEKLHISLSGFAAWVEEWKGYSSLAGVDLAFCNCFDADMKTTRKFRLCIGDDADMKVMEIIEKIHVWLRELRNIVCDRVFFQGRKQQEGEPFNKFFVALNNIADKFT